MITFKQHNKQRERDFKAIKHLYNMFSPGFSAYKLLTYNCCFEKFNERRSPKIIENIQMKLI